VKRVIRWYDYLTINIYWFALTTRSQVLVSLIIPLLVQHYVGESAKGTYVGTMRLWALMVALLVQALMGLLSDRSTLRWGRRRPFILVGSVSQVAVLVFIGYSAGLEGMTGYWVLFALYILSMVSSDTAHAATQGLIPDLVPEEKRGRFSGVKALLELPIPLIFTSMVVARLVEAGNIWGALAAVMIVLVFCAAVTMTVREERLEKVPFAIDWVPFIRLLLMTAAFTAIILAMGGLVRAILRYTAGMEGTGALVVMGVTGLLAMVAAIGLGVWISMRVGVGQEIRDRTSFTWWVVLRLAFMVPAVNLGGFIIYFLQERFAGLGAEKAAGPAAQAVMFVGIFILIFALPGGWLADRFGRKPLVAISGVVAALGTGIVIAFPNLTATYVGSCLIGAGTGLFYAANWALGTDLVPREQAARYLGLSNLAGAGAGAIGAYIGGPIADSRGYVLLYAIYGALFILSAVPLLAIQERRSARAAG